MIAKISKSALEENRSHISNSIFKILNKKNSPDDNWAAFEHMEFVVQARDKSNVARIINIGMTWTHKSISEWKSMMNEEDENRIIVNYLQNIKEDSKGIWSDEEAWTFFEHYFVEPLALVALWTHEETYTDYLEECAKNSRVAKKYLVMVTYWGVETAELDTREQDPEFEIVDQQPPNCDDVVTEAQSRGFMGTK